MGSGQLRILFYYYYAVGTQDTVKCLHNFFGFPDFYKCIDVHLSRTWQDYIYFFFKTVYKKKRGKSFVHLELYFAFASAIMTSIERLLFQCFCSMVEQRINSEE